MRVEDMIRENLCGKQVDSYVKSVTESYDRFIMEEFIKRGYTLDKIRTSRLSRTSYEHLETGETVETFFDGDKELFTVAHRVVMKCSPDSNTAKAEYHIMLIDKGE